mmetsp:Transcript_48034/g.114344  ORF Transcript_48034/g.114344 Transcript_48034/m.114344 type:complete len:207 (-) Transcript_48034:3176-3796(-)
MPSVVGRHRLCLLRVHVVDPQHVRRDDEHRVLIDVDVRPHQRSTLLRILVPRRRDRLAERIHLVVEGQDLVVSDHAIQRVAVVVRPLDPRPSHPAADDGAVVDALDKQRDALHVRECGRGRVVADRSVVVHLKDEPLLLPGAGVEVRIRKVRDQRERRVDICESSFDREEAVSRVLWAQPAPDALAARLERRVDNPVHERLEEAVG